MSSLPLSSQSFTASLSLGRIQLSTSLDANFLKMFLTNVYRYAYESVTWQLGLPKLEISKICQQEILHLDFPHLEQPCNPTWRKYVGLLTGYTLCHRNQHGRRSNTVYRADSEPQSNQIESISKVFLIHHIYLCLIGSDIMVNPHPPSWIKAESVFLCYNIIYVYFISAMTQPYLWIVFARGVRSSAYRAPDWSLGLPLDLNLWE